MWEHCHLEKDHPLSESDLDEMGAQGWELVAVNFGRFDRISSAVFRRSFEMRDRVKAGREITEIADVLSVSRLTACVLRDTNGVKLIKQDGGPVELHQGDQVWARSSGAWQQGDRLVSSAVLVDILRGRAR